MSTLLVRIPKAGDECMNFSSPEILTVLHADEKIVVLKMKDLIKPVTVTLERWIEWFRPIGHEEHDHAELE